jgi:hypothetical protein
MSLNKVILYLSLLLYSSASCYALVSKEKAAQLGYRLTPIGAEKKGNPALGIPDWTGGLKKRPLTKGHYEDPFKNEKPLFVITFHNMNKYANMLSIGLKALLIQYPETFKIPVFKTHRTASFPKRIYENTKWNATHAILSDNLNSITHLKGGIPFPIPESGIQIIWNHLLRWRGDYIHQISNEGVVYPSGKYKIIKSLQEVAFPFYYETQSSVSNNILLYYISRILSPANLAGGALLAIETLDQSKKPRQVWGYDRAQRHVRRFPHVDFDNPALLAENLRTADDTDMYNGSPTHFAWYNRGKVALYIPYNNYRLSDTGASFSDLLTPFHLNPKYTRFELHRVWIVEGILKMQYRHIYSRRVFYIDEDSWQIAITDIYDNRDQLYRVGMAHGINYYEVPTQWSTLEVFHDLQSRRYIAIGLDNETKMYDFSTKLEDKSFTPAALRREGRR